MINTQDTNELPIDIKEKEYKETRKEMKTKSKTFCNKSNSYRKNTFVNYSSDNNTRTTKELSLFKLKNDIFKYRQSAEKKYEDKNINVDQYINKKDTKTDILLYNKKDDVSLKSKKLLFPNLSIDRIKNSIKFKNSLDSTYVSNGSQYSDTIYVHKTEYKNGNKNKNEHVNEHINKNEHKRKKNKQKKKKNKLKNKKKHINKTKHNTNILYQKYQMFDETCNSNNMQYGYHNDVLIPHDNYSFSSDDDSWVDLLENYDSDESLDDYEKRNVKNMLIDIDNIKKRFSNNNFIITCSFSFSIKNVFIRLWKRKSPMKNQNFKTTEWENLNSVQLLDNISNIEYNKDNRNDNIYKSKTKNIKTEYDEYKLLDKNSYYNLTSVVKENEINRFHKKRKTQYYRR